MRHGTSEKRKTGNRARCRLRLEFTGEIVVEVERRKFENYSNVKDWVVEFPQAGLRIL